MGSLPDLVEDIQGVLQVFSDGSIFRLNDLEFNFPVKDDGSVAWKDLIYDKKNNLSLRIYKPKSSATTSDATLPIIYFLHGGGFCVGSCQWPNFHNCCLRLSSALHALVVAPDYRLAPESRLPAAMEDSLCAMKWLQYQALSKNSCDTWLQGGVVDFHRVFILGDSSGGNMAHHLAVRLGPGSAELDPIRVRGYMLMAPFFGGTVRTKSEAEGKSEPMLNLELLDRFWRLSLPVGFTADHPFANPFGPSSPSLESVKLDPMLVIAGGIELLKDRVEDYARRLQNMGKKVDYVEFEGKYHGFFTNDPYSEVANIVLQIIRKFMHENSC
ncbi:hypothetical protein LguiB_033306 [Lonicera macranthoides]